jgi:hypothetical protein
VPTTFKVRFGVNGRMSRQPAIVQQRAQPFADQPDAGESGVGALDEQHKHFGGG